MIDKLKYEEVLAISNDLKTQIEIVERTTKSRDIKELSDFIATVEGYSKFLVNTVEINKDADEALSDLRNQLK